MSRRYPRRRNNSGTNDAFAVLIILILGYAVYHNLSSTSKYLLIGSCTALVVLVFTLLTLIKLNRVSRDRQKARALNQADIQSMSGLDFEKYVAALLENEGYTNISLTEKFDMGVDIIAMKNNIRWGIQVKRYSSMVKADAVRAAVTALNTYHCDRAMVITNSYYSRPARLLAESNDCVLIDRDTLAKWIMRFQAGNTAESPGASIKDPLHTA